MTTLRPIIVEGPDNSGKTTLASALMARVKPWGIYLKSPASRDIDWWFEYSHWVSHICHNIKPPFVPIMDRVPEIGELVYGYYYRGDCRLEHTVQSYQSWSQESLSPIVVICRWQGITKEVEKTVTGENIDASGLREIDLLYGMMARLLGSSGLSVIEHRPMGMEKVEETVQMIEGVW